MALAHVGSLYAQQDVSMTFQNNCNNWGWGSGYVINNGIVTAALLSETGARIMQFDLGSYALLRIDRTASNRGFGAEDVFDGGGFMTWPAPQDDWGAAWGVWPPPPYLSHGVYTAAVRSQTAEAVVISCESPQEQLTAAAGLVLKKTYTLRKGTSRMTVDQSLVNRGAQTRTWGLRLVTELPRAHTGSTDYTSFDFFFPRGRVDKGRQRRILGPGGQCRCADRAADDRYRVRRGPLAIQWRRREGVQSSRQAVDRMG